jgi:hypothetical protein
MKSASDLDQAWVRNANATLQRTHLKEQAVAYLGGKCEICGYSRCLAAMQFHHVNQEDKDFEVSALSNWGLIVKELNKCKLLCATCHAEVHAGIHPSLLTLDDNYDLDFLLEEELV